MPCTTDTTCGANRIPEGDRTRLTPGPQLTAVNQIRDTVVAKQSMKDEALAMVQRRTPAHTSGVMWGRMAQREPKLRSARYDKGNEEYAKGAEAPICSRR